MKILVVCRNSGLGRLMVDTLSKEGHDVYFEAYEDFSRENKPKNPYRFFKNTDNSYILDKQIQSIGPDTLVYLRTDFENEDYSGNFNAFLELCALYHVRFIYLSNTEVISRSAELSNEEVLPEPFTLRGEIAAQCEYRIRMKKQNSGLKYMILRSDLVFGTEDEDDCLQNISLELSRGEGISLDCDYMVYPLHGSDLVYAVKAAVESGRDNEIYNVLGSSGCRLSKLYRELSEKTDSELKISSKKTLSGAVDGEKILYSLEWLRFHELNKAMEKFNKKAVPEKNEEEKAKKNFKWTKDLRQFAEILILFILCVALDQLVGRILSSRSIDCMLIYIVAVSLRYHSGYMYSAITFATIYNFARARQLSFESFGFMAFSDNIAFTVMYLVVGIMISLVVDGLRARNTEIQYDEAELQQEKEELLEINTKMLSVKNEYEKRILSTKYSFSSLYTVLNRISSLQPEKIMVELMNIIADVLETNTVSIYTVNYTYARLMVSLNEESSYMGKSWNIRQDSPEIFEKLSNAEIYKGDSFAGEPALIAPIMNGKELMCLVVINKMKFENMSLYYINLLKTLVVMSGDMMKRANEYYNETRNEHFLPGTTIANCGWFRKIAEFEKEKSQQGFSSFMLVRCGRGNAESKYLKLQDLFRHTDPFGLDSEGNLCILFRNVAPEHRGIVLNKIRSRGIEVEIIDETDRAAVNA